MLQALRQERVRLCVIGAILALFAAANVIGYRDSYPTLAARLRFAAAFSDNPALRLFYGVPHDLASVAGYAEFRSVGLLSVIAAGWGVFAAVRVLRAEEDAGRYELVLAGAVTRRGAAAAVLAALAIESAALWVACALALVIVGSVPGDIGVPQALGIAAAIVLPGALFASVGALASQLAPTHRGAEALGGACIALALLVRVLADLVGGLGGLRLATPLGWAELIRPVTGFSPIALAALIAATVLLAGLAVAIAGRRDVGTGLVPARATRRPRLYLLGSPAQAAVRGEWPTLVAWGVSAGTFALLIGGFSRRIAEEAAKAGLHPLGTTVLTATAYLAFTFVFFTLVVTLFSASRVGVMREEESSGRLETLFALPVSRRAWLAGRLAIAAASTALLALFVGACAWAGAAVGNAGVSATSLLEAGANAVPIGLLFLGVGSVLFLLAPRQSGGLTLTLVGVAFLWELVGALLGAPGWLLDVSPFHHIAAVPEHAFDVAGAIVMLALGAVGALVGVWGFAHRDLTSG